MTILENGEGMKPSPLVELNHKMLVRDVGKMTRGLYTGKGGAPYGGSQSTPSHPPGTDSCRGQAVVRQPGRYSSYGAVRGRRGGEKEGQCKL